MVLDRELLMLAEQLKGKSSVETKLEKHTLDAQIPHRNPRIS